MTYARGRPARPKRRPFRALMQMLAGLVIGVMLAGGTYAVVKIVQIQRAEKATNAADTGLGAQQPDGTGATGNDPAAGTGAAGSNPSGGTGSGNDNAGAGSLEVPDLVGIDGATAITELNKRGIKEVKLTSDGGQGIDASKAVEWRVVSQSTKAGTKVTASTVITLVCRRGY